MKSSTGGALLMGFAAGIIIIFVIMVAFFISYGKSFKLKNEIISVIEQREGMKKEDIIDYIKSRASGSNKRKDPEVCFRTVSNGDDDLRFTIEVTVYMSMERTILDKMFEVKIPVRGETRIIEKGNIYKNATSRNKLQSLLGRMDFCS